MERNNEGYIKKRRLIVPPQHQAKVISFFHGDPTVDKPSLGHWGKQRTYDFVHLFSFASHFDKISNHKCRFQKSTMEYHKRLLKAI